MCMANFLFGVQKMDDNIRHQYYKYMRDKEFKLAYYYKMSDIVDKSANLDTPLVNSLHEVWQKIDVDPSCIASMKSKFIVVLTHISRFI